MATRCLQGQPVDAHARRHGADTRVRHHRPERHARRVVCVHIVHGAHLWALLDGRAGRFVHVGPIGGGMARSIHGPAGPVDACDRAPDRSWAIVVASDGLLGPDGCGSGDVSDHSVERSGTPGQIEGGVMNESIFSNGRLVEQTVDNGDGTGTRTTFDADGNVDTVEQLTGLPIPEPVPPTQAEQIAELQATVAKLKDALKKRD